MRTARGPLAGPGCGVDEHPADCLCDIDLSRVRFGCPSGKDPALAMRQAEAIRRRLDASEAA